MSRDLTHREIEAYGYVLGWMEDWRVKRDMVPGREAARQWWLEVAKSKERPEWQMRQWAEAIRWYLAWLENCQKSGGDARSIPERLKQAVFNVGARRGLVLDWLGLVTSLVANWVLFRVARQFYT